YREDARARRCAVFADRGRFTIERIVIGDKEGVRPRHARAAPRQIVIESDRSERAPLACIPPQCIKAIGKCLRARGGASHMTKQVIAVCDVKLATWQVLRDESG